MGPDSDHTLKRYDRSNSNQTFLSVFLEGIFGKSDILTLSDHIFLVRGKILLLLRERHNRMLVEIKKFQRGFSPGIRLVK